MSFPRYPEYKDSGVEWLGAVPGHWVTSRFSRVLLAIKDGTHGTFKRTSEGHPLLSAKNVSDGSIELGESESLISQEDHEEIVSNGFPRTGDLLLTIVGTIGRACVYSFSTSYAFQRSVCFLRLKPGMSSDYFYYLTQSKFFQEQLVSRSKSSAQAGVYMGDIAACSILFPSEMYEQDAIVRFLNSETIKIDSLIAEQETLIALLKEKRQAVISHAVTKGLDPTVPMQDSGVEWLGEVPAHWQLKRVKHFVINFDQGWSPQCESYPVVAEDEWGVLKVGCVNGGVFNPEENKSLPAELDPLPELGIRKGDLLISRANTRELVGSAAVTLRDYPNLLLCDKLYRLRLDGAVTSAEFVAYYLSIGQVRGQIELSASGASSSMLNISQATILEMAIALPADEEQREIVAFIESEQIKLNALIAEAQHAIVLLKERRSALISAAVTGQIDVRGLIKDEQEQAA